MTQQGTCARGAAPTMRQAMFARGAVLTMRQAMSATAVGQTTRRPPVPPPLLAQRPLEHSDHWTPATKADTAMCRPFSCVGVARGLQYIYTGGTLVGELAGLAIYAVVLWVG